MPAMEHQVYHICAVYDYPQEEEDHQHARNVDDQDSQAPSRRRSHMVLPSCVMRRHRRTPARTGQAFRRDARRMPAHSVSCSTLARGRSATSQSEAPSSMSAAANALVLVYCSNRTPCPPRKVQTWIKST